MNVLVYTRVDQIKIRSRVYLDNLAYTRKPGEFQRGYESILPAKYW